MALYRIVYIQSSVYPEYHQWVTVRKTRYIVEYL